MTGRAIQGNSLFEIDLIGLTERMDDTKVETPYCPSLGIAIIDILDDFRVTTIGTAGNNERAIRGNL